MTVQTDNNGSYAKPHTSRFGWYTIYRADGTPLHTIRRKELAHGIRHLRTNGIHVYINR